MNLKESQRDEMERVTKLGYRTLLSTCWDVTNSLFLLKHFLYIGISILFPLEKIGSNLINVNHTISQGNYYHIINHRKLFCIFYRNRRAKKIGYRWRSLYVGR
jgi:hypothetical protein